MSCGMSSDENSLIFWKTIGTNSPNSPTMTIQIMSSVHRAASQRGTRSRRVLPMCSLLSRSVSGLPIIASTAAVRIYATTLLKYHTRNRTTAVMPPATIYRYILDIFIN